jgi:hypothetical protein
LCWRRISEFVAFSAKQRTFSLGSPAIAIQLTIFADHAMAWDRYRELVRCAGLSYGAYCFRTANPFRNLSMANGDAGGTSRRALKRAAGTRALMSREGQPFQAVR